MQLVFQVIFPTTGHKIKRKVQALHKIDEPEGELDVIDMTPYFE